MALTEDRNVDHYLDQQLRTYLVAADAHIYRGALVTINASGYAQPLVATGAENVFVGIAYEAVDATECADGAKSIRVFTVGDFLLPLSGITIGNIGDVIKATDDGTLTTNPLVGRFVGRAVDVPGPDQVLLRLITLEPIP